MSENDQPYSKPWERYSLEGLNGSGYGKDGFASWDEVFENTKPSCPLCHRLLSPEHLLR